MTSQNETNLMTHREVARVAPATLAILERHADKPQIATFAPTLAPKARVVLELASDLIERKQQQTAALERSDQTDAALHALMLQWTGPLTHDVIGFDPEAFTRRPDVTFDLVHKATAMHDVLGQAGLPAYAPELRLELRSRIDAAGAAKEAAYAARIAVQDTQRELRGAIAVFHAELVPFRRTVRDVLGARHVDAQRLRSSRSRSAEPSVEDTTEPASPAADAPLDGVSAKPA